MPVSWKAFLAAMMERLQKFQRAQFEFGQRKYYTRFSGKSKRFKKNQRRGL